MENGKLIDTLDTDFKEMNIEDRWKLPSTDALGVGLQNVSGTIYKIQVKEVTGKGKTPAAPQKSGVDSTPF